MKILRSIVVFLFILFSGLSLSADQIPGSQYFYLGNGVTFFPLGGSGVSHFMVMDSNLYNPAGFADAKRVTADLSFGGFGGENFLMNVRGSFPTNYGIITGNLLLLTSPRGTTAGNVVGLKGTFSKYISEEWLFGAGLNLGLARGQERDFLTSIDLGTIYRKDVEGTGIGLFDYSIGGALKNLGKNVSYAGYDGFPPLEVDVGGRAEILRRGVYRSRVSGHLALPLNPFSPMLGFGLENLFLDMINVKFGLNIGIDNISPYSAGFDLIFDLEDWDVQFSYSLLPVKVNGGNEVTHNAGLSIAFGTYDKKPPEANITMDNLYFSPNHDGINDEASFKIDLKDNTLIFGWKLEVTDENGNLTKAFFAQDVRRIRHMTFKKYMKRVFAKKEEVEIPEVIDWNGEDADGIMVSDGTYYYTLTAWDENNNKTVAERGRIILDTLVPLIKVRAPELLFSPNDDGESDTLKFEVEGENIEEGDLVVLQLRDRDRSVVLEKSYEGTAPVEFVWDGRDNRGSLVAEGVYDFTIAARDPSGNRSISNVEGIVVKREYEKIQASPYLKAFSPNGDGYFDMNDIRLFSSSSEGLIGWELSIDGEDGRVKRRYSGEKDFPFLISFDGKDDTGNLLPDGFYSVGFKLFFESGNHPEYLFKSIRIDNTAPRLEVTSDTDAFSPNLDGIKDTISFIHRIEHGEGDEFEARILNAQGAVFKSFHYGTNPPKVTMWDGMGDNNATPVEGYYTYTITGKDGVGNITTFRVSPVRLVTGLEQVSLEPGEYVFSPNADGVKDSVRFRLNVDNKQGIVEWRVNIKDRNDDVVRSYNERTMGLKLPQEIDWDGKNDQGFLVEDGQYSVIFSILYDTGNYPISKPKEIKVDIRAPSIDVSVKDPYISPNEDGEKETLTIIQRVRGEGEDTYRGTIEDYTGKEVKSFSWKGTPPIDVLWNGRDEGGTPLREGLYSYAITGEDQAGNILIKRISGVVLVTSYEKVSITGNQEGISPNGDGFLDGVDFSPNLSSNKDLESWSLSLLNSQGKLVKALKGTGVPPDLIPWDGRDDGGQIVSDGEYTYKIETRYKSGNHPSSSPGKIIVDKTPPEYLFVVTPTLFSPDGDGEADTIYMNVEIFDKNGVSDWEINVYRRWGDRVDKSVTFKKFFGKGNYRDTIRWDGYSDPVTMPTSFVPPDSYTYKKLNGRWALLVDSASRYVVDLKAQDSYKNQAFVQRDFDTDILVIKTPSGLKIMINSIEFEYNRADLLPQSFRILDRLIQILERFPKYKILVIGHTDWIGSDEYNQKLSDRRANSVYKYLIEHDVDKEKLTTEGRGEREPIDDNNTEAGRARNRRVEFYLLRKP